MPPPFRLVQSASAAARLDTAAAFLIDLPPDQPATIVAFSRGAADDLARRVAAERRATFGLSRLSLTQFAARAALLALAGTGRSPGTRLGAEAVATRAAFEAVRDGALGYFGPVAGMPGFPRALARTLGEIRLAGIAPEALEGGAAARADLAELLERFDTAFADAAAVDRAELLRVAAAIVRDSSAGGPLVLLDVPLDHAAERALVGAMASVASALLATVPAHDRTAAAALQDMGGVPEAPPGPGTGDLAALRTYLFDAGLTPPERVLDGSLELFSAPGEGRECVEIARRVLDCARAGVRFDEMAIVIRSPRSYFGLVEHALGRAGVPAWFDRGTRRPHPAGRAFLAMLACAAESLSAGRFAEYLSLGQVPVPGGPAAFDSAQAGEAGFHVPWPGVAEGPAKAGPHVRLAEAGPHVRSGEVAEGPAKAGPHVPSGGSRSWAASRDEVFGRTVEPGGDELAEEADRADAERADADAPVVAGTLRTPWKWEQLLGEAAVIGHDAGRWARRLDGRAREIQRQIDEAARTDGPDSTRVRGLEVTRQQLVHLRAFALPIVETLAGWPRLASWGEWIGRFGEIAPRVLATPDHVLRVLADLRPMAGVGPVDLDEARRVLSDRLLSIESEPPARRFGRVFVGTPEQVRGRTFRVVFVPGLAERLFPQKPREDPLLLDGHRADVDASLPTQHARLAAERLLLQLAVGAASERLYVSYPRIELTESRARVPSFYALDLMRAATGRLPDHEWLEERAREAGSASLAWPAPSRPEAAIDDQEHDLAVLRRLLDDPRPDAVKGHAHYLLGLNECLRRSVIDRWSKGQPRWSASDGLRLSRGPAGGTTLAAERLDARAYSLSALQKFSACPYQFALSAIFRLQPLEHPEPLQRMDPLTRGSLFHEIQARCLRDLRARHELPVTAATLAAARDVLRETVNRVASHAHDALAPAVERVWVDEIGAMVRDLDAWLVHLARDGAEWEPTHFEFAFGRVPGERDPGSVPDEVLIDGRYRLRGAVDLVEEHRQTKVLRVTDHKTGRSPDGIEKTIVGGGGVLQPVLYAMAVESALQRPVAGGRLFYCTSAGGFLEHAIPLDAATRAAALDVLGVIDRAIAAGTLAAAPAPEACSRCDFRAVCGPDIERRVRRKPQEAIADLAELRRRP